MNETRHRQLQARLDQAVDQEQRLRSQLESEQQVAALRAAEIQEAARQLVGALDGAQRAEERHKAHASAQEAKIRELQERLAAMTAAEHDAAQTHEGQLVQMVEAQGKDTWSKQEELSAYASEVRKLREERRELKSQARSANARAEQLHVEKQVMESALQHEVLAQAEAQAELAIIKSRLQEAVGDLEQRCKGGQ